MDNSPLARLPAELRNYIYKVAVKSDRPVKIRLDSKNKQLKMVTYGRVLALTETCRRLRDESLGLFYASNHVSITLRPDRLFADAAHPPGVGPEEEGVLGALRKFSDSFGAKVVRRLTSVRLEMGNAFLQVIEAKDLVDEHNQALLTAALRDLKRLGEWTADVAS
ncbi:hypothetical protein LTR36_001971 [Oleoguttula mirabilis]|uniref:Uncharacterized protein n=1 Tax=Oleoguttula mirabilis TaxID=1507867 RepID=A0AAV9JMQ1_9PEZI|nr:hypothetical protein LTR36_001971 [Oleoguttula mirabilis]